MSNFQLLSMNMRLANDRDSHLRTFDHTKLSAINTCPTWGILRYSKHKKMPSTARAMALEAGAAAHEGFAAVRWCQYKYHQATTDIEHENILLHGKRLFGADRFDTMHNVLNDKAVERTNVINFVLEAVETSDFYDDIGDRRRTVSNICESLIAYIDAYDMERHPIWVRDKTDVNTDIGIEIAFDIVVSFEYMINGVNQTLEARFTGKLDGLQWNKLNLVIHENKTGARIDDNWLSQWLLSHQITGYCQAATTFTGKQCFHARVEGMKLPLGKIPCEGIRAEYVPRSPVMFEAWANWFITSILMEEQWHDDIEHAPMFTHSCNRYFSSCSFLPLCAADSITEKTQIISEMSDDEWSPLHE